MKRRKKKDDVRKYFFIIIPLVFILSAVLLVKYASVRNTQQESSKEVTPEEKVEELVQNVNLEGKLPETFPSDFPVYEGAEIDESWESRTKDAYAMSVVWKAGEDPEKVFNFYEEELTVLGYLVTVLSASPDSYTFSLENAVERGFIGIARDGKDTIISVTIGNVSY
jgi:hypothetical protein